MCVLLFGTANQQTGELQGIAGCVSRVVVCGPFHSKQVVQDPRTGQRREVLVVNTQAALQFIASQGIEFPNGAALKKYDLNVNYLPDHAQPVILAVHEEKPAVTQQHVQAAQPYGPPYGNGGQVAAEPPIAGAPRMNDKGSFEELPDIALARTQDGLLDADEQAGTWMDIDRFGNEEKRGLSKPFSQPNSQRAHQ